MTFIYIVAMGLHLLSVDYSLCVKYAQQFRAWGRYILVAAVSAALVTDILIPVEDKILSNALIAILAGALMFTIFKEELPEHEHAGFRWFLAGVLVYVFLLAGSWGIPIH